MSGFRLPPRLTVGGLTVVLMAAACALGPLAVPPLAGVDPSHAALLPPGTRVTEVALNDGSAVVAPEVTRADGGLVVAGARRTVTIPLDRVKSLTTRRLWLGSDRFGRDVLHDLLAGGRLSFLIASFSLVVALALGFAVGLLAATARGAVDAVLMRLVDALLAFPVLFLLILAVALFRPGPHLLVLVLGLTSWMGLARLVRGQVLSLRTRPFVAAAEVAGSRWYRTWLLHFVPNLVGPVSQDAALRLGDLVLAEATLSYLGLGVPPSTPTWGGMVAEGHKVLLEGWWLSTFPGLAIAALVIALALVGDGLQQAIAGRADHSPAEL